VTLRPGATSAGAAAGQGPVLRAAHAAFCLIAFLTPSIGTPPPAGAAQGFNACAVLSAADIQPVLGVAVTSDGKAVDIGARHTCDWTLANGANLRLALFSSPRAETLTRDTSGPRAWQPLGGVGEKAGYRRVSYVPGVISEEVEVVLPDRAFFVQVTGHAGQMPGRDPLLNLARLVVTRES
jgi:hypothetical protein